MLGNLSVVRRCTGHERLGGCDYLPRHRHTHGYIAIVVEGGYREMGDGGRFTVTSGDALVHSQFEAHQNESAASGARILNLPLTAKLSETGLFAVNDPDLLVRVAERDIVEAAEAFSESARPQDRAEADWRDLLAAELRALAPLRLSEWAQTHGMAAETISRGFARAYGVTPHLYRAEARARRAVAEIQTGRSLAAIAIDLGFSDQAHMTRAVRSLTARTPKQLSTSTGY